MSLGVRFFFPSPSVKKKDTGKQLELAVDAFRQSSWKSRQIKSYLNSLIFSML